MDEHPQNISALVALLSGQGWKCWLTGTTALRALGANVQVQQHELLSDASPEKCVELLALVSELGQDSTLSLESLSGRTLEEVLAQRGVTINAIALTPEGSTVDPFEGRLHMQTGKIRTIEAPNLAFRKNPILLLNVARLIADTNYTPSSDVRRYALRDSGNILDIEDRGRHWGIQINELLQGKFISAALQWLQDIRVLGFIMPEIAAMVAFEKTCSAHHKDIWDHTKQVTQKTKLELVVRWAALCHDIGKVWTRTVTRNGKVHFFRHEEHGALLFESIAARFKLDANLSYRVAYVIRHHSRVNLYRSDWTDSAVRRLIRESEGHLDDLITFSKADYTTKRQDRITEMQTHIRDLESRIVMLQKEDAKVPPLPSGLGVAIMKNFQLAPSPLIGDLKRILENAVASGELPERADDALYLGWLKEDPTCIERISMAGGQI